jgi:hypothetical protein
VGLRLDKLGTEVATIAPDEDDILLGGSDGDDISSHGDFASFLAGRKYNPGVRTEIDYGKAYVKTLTNFEYDDINHSWSTLVTAQQQDGVGNTVEEITYGECGQVIRGQENGL